jgi:2-C-methyl-D-erythritol 4-phosphate cytidylyltransferase
VQRTVGVVLAAGKGERARGPTGSANCLKQFREFRGRPLVWHALELFEGAAEINDVVFVGPAPSDAWPELPFGKVVARVVGGDSRPESVRRGLAALPPGTEIVVVHDGVRPNASPALLARVVAAARETGAAVPAIASRDTVKVVAADRVVETIARGSVRLVQTPQAFRRDVLVKAYAALSDRDSDFANLDDAAIVERIGAEIAVVKGEPWNMKITFDEDLEWLA